MARALRAVRGWGFFAVLFLAALVANHRSPGAVGVDLAFPALVLAVGLFARGPRRERVR